MTDRFAPTPEQLAEIVVKHALWCDDAKGGVRADLSGADLSGADLSGADLSGADLRGADLEGADLRGADLRGAYLEGADLSGADLEGADLEGADLEGADLKGADLSGAYLEGADLSGADLRGADLSGADLSDCQMNWQSHDLIAERLLRSAGDDAYKRLAAGLILVSRDWCWESLMRNVPAQVSDLLPWALSEMAAWIKDGDDAPAVVRRAAKSINHEKHKQPKEPKEEQ